jgi:hypothetical protein
MQPSKVQSYGDLVWPLGATLWCAGAFNPNGLQTEHLMHIWCGHSFVLSLESLILDGSHSNLCFGSETWCQWSSWDPFSFWFVALIASYSGYILMVLLFSTCSLHCILGGGSVSYKKRFKWRLLHWIGWVGHHASRKGVGSWWPKQLYGSSVVLSRLISLDIPAPGSLCSRTFVHGASSWEGGGLATWFIPNVSESYVLGSAYLHAVIWTEDKE